MHMNASRRHTQINIVLPESLLPLDMSTKLADNTLRKHTSLNTDCCEEKHSWRHHPPLNTEMVAETWQGAASCRLQALYMLPRRQAINKVAGQHVPSQFLNTKQEGAASPCKGRNQSNYKAMYINARDNTQHCQNKLGEAAAAVLAASILTTYE